MKLLITLNDPIALIIHETLSLAFALAAFGHEIQLDIGNQAANAILQNIVKPPYDNLAKMLSSLDLYDMPPAWISAEILQQYQHLPENLASQLSNKPTPIGIEFDSVFNF